MDVCVCYGDYFEHVKEENQGGNMTTQVHLHKTLSKWRVCVRVCVEQSNTLSTQLTENTNRGTHEDVTAFSA